MGSKSRFVGADASIQWSKLAGFIGGAIAAAVGMGVSGVTFAFGDLLLAVPRWFATYYARVIELWVGIGIAAVNGSWDAVLPLIAESGPLALVVSVAIVFASWYIIAWGVSKIG